jgi:hypothetical protein
MFCTVLLDTEPLRSVYGEDWVTDLFGCHIVHLSLITMALI